MTVNKWILICLGLFILSCSNTTDKNAEKGKILQIESPYKLDLGLVHKAKMYCKKNGLNGSFFFLLDFSIRSGKKRFFKIDIAKKNIELAGLVAHGHCQEYSRGKAKFSNVSGSNCSSLGHYKIGGKYDGSFGTAYKLHGLDITNNNAFKRFVVLHAHGCVPNDETLLGICRSEGCPTLSPDFLKRLEPSIDKSTKPVMLWMITN